MYFWAVFSATVTTALLLWAVVTGGRILDYRSGWESLKKNFRLWHIAIAGLLLVLVPWGISAGMASAGKADVVNGYKQFLNGALFSADVQKFTCERDGDCTHVYDCDPYKVVDSSAYTDTDGVYHSEVSHTAYHDCPETTVEYSYTVSGTFGFKNVVKTIGYHDFALHPHVWRDGEEGEVEGGVFRGVPPEWLRYKRDLEHHNADPLTDVDVYTNYILASQSTILRAYSDEVDAFLKRGLLPEHTLGFLKGDPIRDTLNAYKVSFVGFKPGNAAKWQARLMHFNAALGMKLQGDLHIVAIDDHVVGRGRSETYANALKAYWQGPKMGKKALAKNGIIVVLGVNRAGNTISWARANTGMPVGNGEMIAAIESRLAGKPFSPQAVLGSVRAVSSYHDNSKTLIKYSLGYGVLAKIMFHDYPFARACMGCKDKSDNGTSFTYLEADIKVPGWAQFLNIFFCILLGVLTAGLIYATSPANLNPPSRPRY